MRDAVEERTSRRHAVGAEPDAEGVSFRVWAPDRTVTVETAEGARLELAAEGDGYHSGHLAGAAAGLRYRLMLDTGGPYPDPASRAQPEGVHGWSEVVDPAAFAWSDAAWSGTGIEGQVIYEMHVGTFTQDGTWAAAAEELERLRDLGITLIEMMPVAAFPGRFGWGYDGVHLFAPTSLYGAPDDLRRFVDRAHGLGLGVILDVVYNHVGPDGSHLVDFSPDYFSERHETEWGTPINFDGPGAEGARGLVLANAAHWIEEYHFDGLRLDATQSIFDDGPDHILGAIVRAARAAAGSRRIVVVSENEPQDTRMIRAPAEGGFGMDAVWNDDFHHSAHVAATGRRPAYYGNHSGAPQEFVSAAKYGYLFQGQNYGGSGRPRGTPGLHLPAAHFVTFLQNHDQIANSGRGQRLTQMTSPGRARALTALMLLGPGTPMLFQGQEFGATSPFLYFADHVPAIGALVRAGRHDSLRIFPAIADPLMFVRLHNPEALSTFEASRIDPASGDEAWLALHRDLIRLRREDPVIRRQGAGGLDGAVVGPEGFVLRWFDAAGDRLLLVNLGLDLDLPVLAEPLLGPDPAGPWSLIWSSETPAYGGDGTPAIESGGKWFLPGHSAMLLGPGAAEAG